jgi:GGDEF domain-containing protein
VDIWRGNAPINLNLNQRNASSRQIHTHDSRIGDNIGAAAYYPTLEQTQHRYLSKNTDHNMYAAKLEPIGLVTNQDTENTLNG